MITKGNQLYLTGFSTSPPTVAPKSDKPHALVSGQSADRLDNLSCIRINEWENIIQVTYILMAIMFFYFNQCRCQCGGAELSLENGKYGSQY